jgi:hypothetical protein
MHAHKHTHTGTARTNRSYGDVTNGRPQLRWTDDLKADITSVVVEAGLSPTVAVAVVESARKGAVADNPGVLLCQVCM